MPNLSIQTQTDGWMDGPTTIFCGGHQIITKNNIRVDIYFFLFLIFDS